MLDDTAVPPRTPEPAAPDAEAESEPAAQAKAEAQAESAADVESDDSRGRLTRTNLSIRLSRADRAAIGVTLGAHAALAVIEYCAAWIQGRDAAHLPLTGGYQHWDANLYVNYAQHGLFSASSAPNNAAFLPGYPILLAFVHLFVRNWLDSALLLSLVAGCVTAVLLNRMAGSTRAGLFLFTAPAAVFLCVGYSESVFLAFAVIAWYAAQRGEWSVASLFAGLAGLTRIDGLALIPALALFAFLRPGDYAAIRSLGARRVAAASTVAASAVGPFLYALYLRRATSSWTAWQDANRKGWHLQTDWPWISLRNTWRGAYEYADGPGAYAWSFQLELACTIAAALLVIVLFARHQWPEALYCALVLAGMVCTNTQQAADRGLLICFPLYPLLARAADRRPWIGNAYVWINAPIALVAAFLYTSGSWSN